MRKRKNNVVPFKYQTFSRKQQKLLTWWTEGSPYRDYDMVIADGAVRSGKTVSMVESFMNWSMTTFENQVFILAGRSMGALKRNVLNPLFQMLSAKGVEYVYVRSTEEPRIEVGTNVYYLFGANNERSQDVIAGLTAAGALADEIALLPQSFVDQMIARCSVEGSKVFGNCNPQGPYHYFKQEYIDKAKEKHILYLHFTMEDNYTLSERVKERYRRMFTGVFYQRYILGLWVLAQGIIYDMFNREEHTVSTIARKYSKFYVSIDYGTQNPTVFGLWGFAEGAWIKVKEYHYEGRKEQVQKTDAEYSRELKKFVDGFVISGVIVDPSAASFIAQLRKDGFTIIKAKNDVIDGIRNVMTALQTGLIKYNDCCHETFREYGSYVWDAKAAEKGIDQPIKQNDHHMDSDRYFVNTVVIRKGVQLIA